MKKALLLASILFISVVTTACINNFAVQELNTTAQKYMDSGDYTSAIERLKSSIDLDGTIFETHYNLAVAYTKNENYINAIEEYQKAINLNSSVAETYYSLAVAQSNLITDLESGLVTVDEDGNVYAPEKSEEDDTVDNNEKTELSENVLNKIAELKTEAIKNYQTYLEKSPDAPEASEVKNKIESLQKTEADIEQ